MFDRLKKRWKLESNLQAFTVLVVFAITGSATVYIKKLFFGWIGISPDTNLLIRIPVYIVSVLAIYNVLLLIIGFIFGQFRFFLDFEKKFFNRFIPKRRSKSVVNYKIKS